MRRTPEDQMKAMPLLAVSPATGLVDGGDWRGKRWQLCFAFSVQPLEQSVLHCLLQDFVITQEGLKWGCLHSLLGLLVSKKTLDKSLNMIKHQALW